MEKTWYCPFSGSARGVVEYQNTRIKPSNIPTYIRLFYFAINYCWFQLMMAAKGELKVDAASQPPFFFVFGPTSLCTNAPSPTKINVFFIFLSITAGFSWWWLLKENWKLMQLRSHPPSSFLGLLACVQTPPPLQKSRIERFFFFLREGAVVHRLGTQGLLDMASPCSE